jgi:hypothetical protein
VVGCGYPDLGVKKNPINVVLLTGFNGVSVVIQLLLAITFYKTLSCVQVDIDYIPQG